MRTKPFQAEWSADYRLETTAIDDAFSPRYSTSFSILLLFSAHRLNANKLGAQPYKIQLIIYVPKPTSIGAMVIPTTNKWRSYGVVVYHRGELRSHDMGLEHF